MRIHGMDGEEREVLKGHHGPVHCIEFSPDGELFASGSGASSPHDATFAVVLAVVLIDPRALTPD